MTNLISSKMSPFTSLALILTLILSGIDYLSCIPVSISPVQQHSTESISTSPPTTTSLTISPIPPGRVLELTNVKRQIGNSSRNPIWNLHTKVNGQGERGGQELNVTDVFPSSEFTTTTFKRSKDVLEYLSDLKNLNSNSLPSSAKSSRRSNSRDSNISSSSRISVNVTKDPDDTEPGSPTRMLIRYNSVNDVDHSGLQRRSQSDLSGLQPIVVPEENKYSKGSGSDLKYQVGSCLPVIVNQTLLRNNTGMDKWSRELIKITQCIANCLKYNRYYNKMSPKKGMNGIGGSTSPLGISSHNPHQHNGDIMRIMKHNLNDKLLSSCQKTCKFLPRKSTTTPTKRKGLLIETNKEDEEMKRIPTSIPIPIKPDDSYGLELTLSDTGVVHLHWSKKNSSPTSNKMSIVYTVILGRKLIVQTVAQETELGANICEKDRTKNSTSTQNGYGPHDRNIIRVFAVSSKGLEKLFSGYISCCKEVHEDLLSRQPSIPNREVVDENCKQTESANKTRDTGTNKTFSVSDETLKPTNWGLHTVSMIPENSLVVTEVSWSLPGGPSNYEQDITRDRSENGMKKYMFLITWEVYPEIGLKGNLVTESTSGMGTGTLSLLSDSAYFIQVGLINTKSLDLSPSSKTNTSVKSSSNGEVQNEEEKQEENYMNSNLREESIIFPLSDGEPSVTIKSERLFVNTSQLSILSSSLSLSSSSPVSNSSTSGSKSNNPFLPKEQGFYHGQPKNVSFIPIRARFGTSEITPATDTATTISNIGSGGRINSSSSISGSSLVSKNRNDHRRKDGYGNGYMADSPQASKYYEEEGEAAVLAHSYRSTLRKNSTSGPNGYEDKKRNINDNKSNNNLKPKPSPKIPTSKTSDHNRIHGIFSRPDVYQSLFALDSETSSDESMAQNGDSSVSNNKGERPSVVYSVFVLVIVACVIFLFLVSFIGFFVVTSSISKTAQYFVPKRLRIWVVGETELLGDVQVDENDEEEELEYAQCQRDIDDLDDDGPEWSGILNSTTSTSIQRE